ncbi:MAG: DedA family protein [Proteobacteria bacterium]|nr:DedA family protein [Pseudomonadota bacterium]
MADSFLQFIKGIDGAYLYPALFISAVLENLIPPIPGDTVTLFGAYLVGIGQLSFSGVFAATALGNFVGFMLLFFLGRFLEKEFFLNRNFRYFPKENLLKAERWFQKFGYMIILFNRFLSGARSVISIFAGISELKTGKVAIYCLFSCLLWNGMLIYAGYKAGKNWETLTALLKQYNTAVLVLIAAALVIFAGNKILKRLRKAGST